MLPRLERVMEIVREQPIGRGLEEDELLAWTSANSEKKLWSYLVDA